MTIKKPNQIKAVTDKELNSINQNWDTLYSLKLESRHKRTESGVTSHIYQSMETGEVWFSANGSATTQRSFGFEERQSTIIVAVAQARSSGITATVMDVTNTGITIECYPTRVWDIAVSTCLSLMTFSQATTASVSIYYLVVGSNP